MSSRIAIVTGSNKGIGYSTVKILCERFEGIVYLTARDVHRGTVAQGELIEKGFKPEFHQLDVADEESVKTFAEYIKNKHGGIDILINNAAILDFDDYYPIYENCKRVIDVNYRSMIIVEKYLFPLLRNNARVVNVSSNCGHIANLNKHSWIDTLMKRDLTVDDINAIVDEYLEMVENGTFIKEYFKDNAMHHEYKMSKIALTALTFIQQKKYEERGIKVNAVHPGFVKTDMTKGLGDRQQDEGADSVVYVALDAPDTVKGKYLWFDKRIIEWYDPNSEFYCKFRTGD